MLFHFHTKLRRPADVAPSDFYAVWLKEARASLVAAEAGIIPAIWKVAGKDEVIGVIEAPDAEGLDRGLHSLPIWSTGNNHLVESITWSVLRPYDNWADELEELSKHDTDPA